MGRRPCGKIIAAAADLTGLVAVGDSQAQQASSMPRSSVLAPAPPDTAPNAFVPDKKAQRAASAVASRKNSDTQTRDAFADPVDHSLPPLPRIALTSDAQAESKRFGPHDGISKRAAVMVWLGGISVLITLPFVMTGTWQTMIVDALWLVFFAGAMVGCLFMIAAATVVRSFSRGQFAARRSEPAVTVLVPLHGEEPGLFDNLAAFCEQDYSGEVQLLLGVADRHDSAVGVVTRLQAAFPHRQIDLVVNAHGVGSNPKVANLIGMSSGIRHEIIVLVDSDIRVAPDHLRRVVSALERSGSGAVTCPYFGISTGSLWSRLARLAIDGHFLPSIMVGVRFKLARPCFGSTIALTRNSLAAIGGFEAVANCLADDYALGDALRRRGETVCVLPMAVGHICSESSWRELWLHEVRWALTIRTVDPLGYAGWGVTHAFPLALAALCLGGGNPALALAALAIGCRIALLLAIERGYGLPAHPFWLVPVRDLLCFAVFIAGLAGRAVSWKGRRFRVLSEYGLILKREAPLP